MRTKRDIGYKDGTVQTLAVPSPAEPLNATSADGQGSRQAKPVLQPRRVLNGRREADRLPVLIPVLAVDGKPLTPCKRARARKLLRDGVAKKCWNKLGQFYLKMLAETRCETPEMALGLDPGSRYDGVAVASESKVQTTAMLELPTGIADKLTNRRQLRRARRYRNCRRRPKRFDNRKRRGGWIAPSQEAKVGFRLRIISELCRFYPITDFVVEDVAFNHYTKRGGKHFSTVEIGKAKLYSELRERGRLKLYGGRCDSPLC